MRRVEADLAIGFIALSITLVTGGVILFLWYQDYRIGKQFLQEAQKIPAIPILGVSEGQVAKWTREIRKNETTKGELDRHLSEQIRRMRSGAYTTDQFHQHLLSCKKFCGLFVDKIFIAHTQEIAKLPHDIVFFGFDQDYVTPRYAREVREFTQNYPNQTIFLVGRASYIGQAGYNKDLSGRRVANVKAILRNSGIPEEQIRSFWIGFEAPQLTREIADLYQVDAKEYNEDLYALNQSVVMHTQGFGSAVQAQR